MTLTPTYPEICREVTRTHRALLSTPFGTEAYRLALGRYQLAMRVKAYLERR